VEVEDLSTRLNGTWIHRKLNLDIYRGEVLAIIGESGGGKTMLLRQIIRLLSPTEGHIRVFGEPVHHLEGYEARRISRRWGVLFQQGALFSALNIFDNIAFPMRELQKDGEKIDEDMVNDLVRVKLDMVGLKPDVTWKWPSELSGGMVKRAAMERALALEPELLFLDEPSAGLDPIAAKGLDELFVELRRDLNLRALLITHDLETLAGLADRVAVLVEGKILTTGTLEEVSEYDHPFLRQFFDPRRGDKKLRVLTNFRESASWKTNPTS
jgi:phospholipid/cholesterol/gamma-HCH transport system ATP-binding protein